MGHGPANPMERPIGSATDAEGGLDGDSVVPRFGQLMDYDGGQWLVVGGLNLSRAYVFRFARCSDSSRSARTHDIAMIKGGGLVPAEVADVIAADRHARIRGEDHTPRWSLFQVLGGGDSCSGVMRVAIDGDSILVAEPVPTGARQRRPTRVDVYKQDPQGEGLELGARVPPGLEALQTLQGFDSDPVPGVDTDWFGISLAARDGRGMIGAALDSRRGTFAGACYFIERGSAECEVRVADGSATGAGAGAAGGVHVGKATRVGVAVCDGGDDAPRVDRRPGKVACCCCCCRCGGGRDHGGCPGGSPTSDGAPSRRREATGMRHDAARGTAANRRPISRGEDGERTGPMRREESGREGALDDHAEGVPTGRRGRSLQRLPVLRILGSDLRAYRCGGRPRVGGRGAVQVFKESAADGLWSWIETVTDPNPYEGERFGRGGSP